MIKTARGLVGEGKAFVLATIFSHSGSTPRSAGSRMIVTQEGCGIGTIGGGLLEAQAISRARKLLVSGQSQILHFDLSHEIIDTMDMICGGQSDVLLACVRPTEENRAVFERWQGLLTEGGGALLTKITGTEKEILGVSFGVMTAQGSLEGDLSLSRQEREALATAVMSGGQGVVPVVDGFILVMPERRVCTVYLFGAGHVAVATARMAALAGFRVSVIDDRAEYASRERFPDAWQIRVQESFDQGSSGAVFGQEDYVVILTRGHLHDRTVLARALKTDAGYIGMIGSRRKRDAIYSSLFEEGFCQADVDRVHSPIGLSIGAETPEEIAVSIVAEMIRHRAGKA